MPAGWFQDEFSGARAPQHVRGINWASPFSRGLEFAAMPFSGGYADWVSGRVPTNTTRTIAPRAFTGGHQSLTLTAPSDVVGDQWTGMSVPAGFPMSVWSWAYHSSAVATYNGGFQMDAGSGQRYGFYYGWQGNSCAFMGSGNTGISVTDDRWQLLGVNIYSSSDVTAYVMTHEGGLSSVASTGLSMSLPSAFTRLWIGTDIFNVTSRCYPEPMGGQMVYGRTMEESEIIDMFRAPFDIYDQGYRYISLPAAAGGGGVPIFNHHYRTSRAA